MRGLPRGLSPTTLGGEGRIARSTTRRRSTTVPPDLLEQSEISEEELRERGVEVRRVKFLALGGGVGSFTWVDMLRCCGVDAQDIAVVGNEEHAIARYRRLCANSQIPDHERLRSHSESCPDNVWGFPATRCGKPGASSAAGTRRPCNRCGVCLASRYRARPGPLAGERLLGPEEARTCLCQASAPSASRATVACSPSFPKAMTSVDTIRLQRAVRASRLERSSAAHRERTGDRARGNACLSNGGTVLLQGVASSPPASSSAWSKS